MLCNQSITGENMYMHTYHNTFHLISDFYRAVDKPKTGS